MLDLPRKYPKQAKRYLFTLTKEIWKLLSLYFRILSASAAIKTKRNIIFFYALTSILQAKGAPLLEPILIFGEPLGSERLGALKRESKGSVPNQTSKDTEGSGDSKHYSVIVLLHKSKVNQQATTKEIRSAPTKLQTCEHPR